MRNSYKILIAKQKDKKPLGGGGRESTIIQNNIKIVLKEIGFKSVDWIHLAQDRIQ
jgi:hypothetical protein